MNKPAPVNHRQPSTPERAEESNQRIRNLEKIAEKMDLTDDKGNFTLKKQKGADAARFLAAMGFPLSIME